MRSEMDIRAINEELEHVLASKVFLSTQRSQSFLRYIVERSLLGGAPPKEYEIAVDVFGRGADYDPAIDATVRVEAGRLRTRLREYYDIAGAADPILIEIPKGGYTATFMLRETQLGSHAREPARASTESENGDRTEPLGLDGAGIAVLPFANLSPDKENEYFSDGLAEEILIALSRVEGLRVTARSSSFFFKGKSVEMSEIASKLHIANILDGSVRRVGNRVRVTVQLVDARSGFQLWSERYDRQMEDIFEVQDEISRAIADQLKVTLGVGIKQATKNLEAYELYLKGRHLANQRMPGTVRQAIQSYEQAIQLDPQFALAHSGLADSYGALRVYQWISAEEGGPPALAAISKAIALAPDLWEVIFSRGLYSFYFGRNWREAGPDFQKAVLCNPQSSIAHEYMAIFHAMSRNANEAVAHATHACRHDPLSSYIHGLTACSFHVLGYFDKAESYARKALELQPTYLTGLWVLGLSQSSLGRYQEAVETLEQVAAISRSHFIIGLLGSAYHGAGRAEDASRLLNELEERRSRGEFVPAKSFLNIYAGAGDVAAARRALSKSIAESCPAFTMSLMSSSVMSALRADPESNRMLVELLGY